MTPDKTLDKTPAVVPHTRTVTVSTLRGGRNANLFELVAEKAATRPDAIAVIDARGVPTTYGQLVDRATNISDDLVDRGLRPEETIGVLMHRTPELLATLLGILRAGGAYVPLDPADPMARTQRMIVAAGCRLVIGHPGPLAALSDAIDEERSADHGERVQTSKMEFLDVERAGRRSDVSKQACAPGGEQLAYVLFTSGSTGTPKGVAIEHRNLTWFLSCAEELLGFTENDRYLATATIAFDMSVPEVYLPLVTGGIVVLRDRDLLLRPAHLAAEIRRHGVTVFQTSPSVWDLILREVPDFPRLRVAISAGEPLSPELAARLRPVADQVWNLYGPTETTVWTAGLRVDHPACGVDGRSPAVPVGWPLTDVEMLVVDEDDQQLPDGVEGQLLIGGPALGRGYHGRPDLTAQQFVTLGNARRYYRTGDRGERAPDGSVAVHGRTDDQIKIRGVRIEPMEIETRLLDDPCVVRCAVTWYSNASGNKALLAAVRDHDSSATAADIQHRLSKVLPVQMLPSRYVLCDSLPMTPSGKIDRVALRERAGSEQSVASAIHDLETLTPTEETIAGIWKLALGRTSLSRSDHFFSVGGDSLVAVSVLLDIEDAFGIQLPANTLFDTPELADLAAIVDTLRGGTGTQGAGEHEGYLVPLVRAGSGRPLFFASVEEPLAGTGVWTLDCPVYAIAYAVPGKGLLKAKTLERYVSVHVAAIRAVQPRGPYRIAGYSFGGLVAVEIARQLRESGEEIEMLFLLDPSEPRRTENAPSIEQPLIFTPPIQREKFPTRVARHLRHTFRHPENAITYAKEKVPLLPKAVLNTTGWGPLVSYHVHDFHLKHPNRLLQALVPTTFWPAFLYGADRMAKNYVVRTHTGPALAVFLRESDRTPVWRSWLGPQATFRRVPGDHHSMFAEPVLSTWVRILHEALHEALVD